MERKSFIPDANDYYEVYNKRVGALKEGLHYAELTYNLLNNESGRLWLSETANINDNRPVDLSSPGAPIVLAGAQAVRKFIQEIRQTVAMHKSFIESNRGPNE